MLKENYRNVQENIQRACEKVNRSVDEVTLISVSKTKPLSMLQEAYDCGAREYGENKVQEMTEKEGQLPKDIHWHMIGHLQTNKVKYIAPYVHLIHSVDSLKLAQEINRQGEKCNRSIPILIEVNIAEEESKFGIKKDETISLVREISKLPHVAIKGLMTIAPFVDDPEDNRVYFRGIKELSVDIANENIDNVCMDVLSMGMTGDYMVAIEEGATMVRVGTGIFGERDYTGERN
ncbi:MAG: YggS family pyridoxal phosphate-dependent enzyme [Agathobacter sp.]|nr:YggS family pyridoxal phosphate-dependent enzyme [Agathobacter sp.]